MFRMAESLVDNDRFGYVENASLETEYRNIDYRDTLVPLWETLRKHVLNIKEKGEKERDQDAINLALCATILQLGKNVKYNSDLNYEEQNAMRGEIAELKGEIAELKGEIEKLSRT